MYVIIISPSIEVEIYCFTSHRSFARPICCFVSVHSLCLSCKQSITRLFCVCTLSPSILKAVKHETLTQCRAIVGPPSTPYRQHAGTFCMYVACDRPGIRPVLVQCWPTVCGAESALYRRWVYKYLFCCDDDGGL